MINIKVRKINNLLNFYLPGIVIIGIIIYGIYTIFTGNEDTDIVPIIFIISFLTLILIWGIQILLDKTLYVSDINIYDEYIELIYKSQNKFASAVKIQKSDIQSCSLSTHTELIYRKYTPSTKYLTKFIITLNNGKKYSLKEKSNGPNGSCPHEFTESLIKYHTHFPEFNYIITGKDTSFKSRMDYLYIQNGSELDKQQVIYQNYKPGSKVDWLYIICMTVMILAIIWFYGFSYYKNSL